MSAIASTLRKHWIEVAWAIFALLNLVFVFRTDNWESIPFHLIWVSLTLVYWIRHWRLRTTIVVVIATALLCELAMWHSDFAPGGPGLDKDREE